MKISSNTKFTSPALNYDYEVGEYVELINIDEAMSRNCDKVYVTIEDFISRRNAGKKKIVLNIKSNNDVTSRTFISTVLYDDYSGNKYLITDFDESDKFSPVCLKLNTKSGINSFMWVHPIFLRH